MDLEHNENEELEVTPAEPEAAPEAEPETAPVPEAEPEEKPAEKKPGMSKGAKIAIFLAALALVAAIAACVLLITGRKDHPAGTEAQQTEATEATDGTTETVADKTLEAGEEVTTTYGKAANLIDADNFGKNAVTDNAAYTTGTAEAGDVQMRTVVARDATGYCLTNADLQIYYWMEFYQLMNNYGSYASMLGLDYTKALALQDAPSGGTWEQYFLTSATNNFAEIRALYLAAQEAGYKLPETEAKSIEDVLEPVDENGMLLNERITCRHRDEIIAVDREVIDYIDVSPKMMTSIATAFIPFLQNDDANRALMGANMQRQAVPLMVTEAPIVATGVEQKCAVDSEVCIKAEGDGVVTRVSADGVSVRYDDGSVRDYTLTKFARSNQGTCVNQRPIVTVGERVTTEQVLADGPACSQGEIALGKNVLVGFVTWEGYNYEDAILLNERLVREDVFTSIHIEEYETESRDTKLGPEEITRDIPNVGEDTLKDLDENGVIRIGAEVKSGDYLVGKVTPKGETELTAEERLLRAIFGEKAREVRDTSLKVPHGESGIIVDVKVFTRQNGDEMAPGVNKIVRVYIAQKRKISVGDKMAGRHGNKGVVSRILPEEDMPFLPDGTPLDIALNPLGVPSRMNIGQVLEVHLGYAAHALGWKPEISLDEGIKRTVVEYCVSSGLY